MILGKKELPKVLGDQNHTISENIHVTDPAHSYSGYSIPLKFVFFYIKFYPGMGQMYLMENLPFCLCNKL